MGKSGEYLPGLQTTLEIEAARSQEATATDTIKRLFVREGSESQMPTRNSTLRGSSADHPSFGRMICLVLLSAALIVISAGTAQAININSRSAKALAQAYGFVLAQEISLDNIAKKFPSLEREVEVARLRFESTFPKSLEQIEKELLIALGESELRRVSNALREKIATDWSKNAISRPLAVDFLERVAQRAKGEIASPVLEYLLALRYQHNLVGEFLNGFRQRFRTSGKGKSQGIQLGLQVPRSWAGAEGERPHIVQKWVSENGTGQDIIMLYVNDGEGFNPTKAEIAKLLASEDVKNELPEGAAFVASGSFTIETRPGYWVEFVMSNERVETTVVQEAVQYVFFFRDKVVSLMCMTGAGPGSEAALKQRFKQIRPLCQQVMNSVVLSQVY